MSETNTCEYKDCRNRKTGLKWCDECREIVNREAIDASNAARQERERNNKKLDINRWESRMTPTRKPVEREHNPNLTAGSVVPCDFVMLDPRTEYLKVG